MVADRNWRISCRIPGPAIFPAARSASDRRHWEAVRQRHRRPQTSRRIKLPGRPAYEKHRCRRADDQRLECARAVAAESPNIVGIRSRRLMIPLRGQMRCAMQQCAASAPSPSGGRATRFAMISSAQQPRCALCRQADARFVGIICAAMVRGIVAPVVPAVLLIAVAVAVAAVAAILRTVGAAGLGRLFAGFFGGRGTAAVPVDRMLPVRPCRVAHFHVDAACSD